MIAGSAETVHLPDHRIGYANYKKQVAGLAITVMAVILVYQLASNRNELQGENPMVDYR